jgi:hypothetical protein
MLLYLMPELDHKNLIKMLPITHSIVQKNISLANISIRQLGTFITIKCILSRTIKSIPPLTTTQSPHLQPLIKISQYYLL